MSTEERRADPPPTPPPGGEPKSSDVNLADELREFGKQIEAVITTARTSPRGKDLENQITSAWRDVEKGVNTTINRVQSTDLKGTVTGSAQTAADEIQGGLARGLRSLNQWMSKQVQETEARRKKREEEINLAATNPETDNPIADRFGSAEPSFGNDKDPVIVADPENAPASSQIPPSEEGMANETADSTPATRKRASRTTR